MRTRMESPPSPKVDEDVYDDDDDEDEDEDDEMDRDPHAALVDSVRSDNRNNREALAYLLRYETMVRQQEAEDMATLAHLRPCLERLMELLPNDFQTETNGTSNNHHNKTNSTANGKSTKKDPLAMELGDDDGVWTKEISYASLQKALETLELQEPTEFMTTDRQLMMILRLLTQTPPGRHQSAEKATLTWAELVQCYKTCIVGMTTLQHLPNQDETRQRARDRTLAMLALFEPQSRLYSSALGPARPVPNTRALSFKQRSSFAPQRSTKRTRHHRMWALLAATAVLFGAAGFIYYQQQMASHSLPLKKSGGKKSSQSARTSKPAPTFSVRSMVPTSTTAASATAKMPVKASTTNTNHYEGYDDEYDDEMGVAGPALLVATIGTPFLVTLTKTFLQQLGTGASFVAATSSISALGHTMVTVAGFISLTSLVYRSLRALLRGLGRLGKVDDE